MKLLAFDTSTTACTVSLLIENPNEEPRLYISHQVAPLQQAKLILPAIQSLLEQANLSVRSLDAVAFGAGPGSYTGNRIAASVAQGIAFTNKIPVIAVSSLSVLAKTAYQQLGWSNLLVAVDARQNQVYFAAYQIDDAGNAALVGQELACDPANIPVVGNQTWYGIGDGWGKYAHDMVKCLGYQPAELNIDLLPEAGALATLAKRKWEEKDWHEAEEALPIYLR